MVGIVLVSHSKALADATLALIKTMTGEVVPIAVAAGTGENHAELGTDAMDIYSSIEAVYNEDGVLVLMDMGSAVLSAEMALDFLEDDKKKNVKLCPSPFVEGAVAAGVASKIGSSLTEVYHEATVCLKQKEQHIAPEEIPKEPQFSPDMENAKTIQIIIPNPHGLHARPVARLIQEASKYNCNLQLKNLSNGKGPASIRSMTEIISLEVLQGNTVELIAKGEDADRALEDLERDIKSGLGDSLEETSSPNIQSPQKSDLQPIGISKGLVIDMVFYPTSTPLDIPDALIQDSKTEIEKLTHALHTAKEFLIKQSEETNSQNKGEEGNIFKAQIAILDDPSLIKKANEKIERKKYNALFAWHQTIKETINIYKNLTDKNLQQRALDLQDISTLVLKQLGAQFSSGLDIPGTGIIVVEDITPWEVTDLNKTKIKGVICLENGPTSHSAILLRSRGIPAIVQAHKISGSLLNLPTNTKIAMDGESGEIWINPEGKKLTYIEAKKDSEKKLFISEKQDSHKPAITLDGKKIEIFANVGRKEDSESAIENGAEGIGLLRTEFMFIERDKAPTEEEQVNLFTDMLSPMKGKPIIIRTLDAGGDKEIPYLNMPKEANPFLGVRAIRLCLKNTNLFQEQLRAILKISSNLDVRIMFPMISTLEELRQAKAELEKAHNSLRLENIPHSWPIKTGMMMEVPSAAIMAHEFIKEVDFISIGTNDLIQYTMAADRGNPALQNTLGKGFDPSVIELIKHICEAAIKQNIPVAVCGESASNPELASILVGLGVNELSMNSYSIPSMKQWVRNQNFNKLKEKAL